MKLLFTEDSLISITKIPKLQSWKKKKTLKIGIPPHTLYIGLIGIIDDNDKETTCATYKVDEEKYQR